MLAFSSLPRLLSPIVSRQCGSFLLLLLLLATCSSVSLLRNVYYVYTPGASRIRDEGKNIRTGREHPSDWMQFSWRFGGKNVLLLLFPFSKTKFAFYAATSASLRRPPAFSRAASVGVHGGHSKSDVVVMLSPPPSFPIPTDVRGVRMGFQCCVCLSSSTASVGGKLKLASALICRRCSCSQNFDISS